MYSVIVRCSGVVAIYIYMSILVVRNIQKVSDFVFFVMFALLAYTHTRGLKSSTQ